MNRKRVLVLSLVLAPVLAVLLVVRLNLRYEGPVDSLAAPPPTAELVRRGEYLVRAGNCVSCHTVQGGAAFAGGLGIRTPFGTVYTSNLTPDNKTGIGAWSNAEFWRAMHNGRSRDGRLLYPAFPYPNYTHITREDSDALLAYLKSLPPVEQANRAHALRFPYDTQAALAVWRAMFFVPQSFEPEPAKSAEWNRGAYLVRGLGHCNACHASRNAFGATSEKLELSGGFIPAQNWYAPSLNSPAEAGVAGWNSADVVQLLKTGVSPRGAVLGPMVDVIFNSTQFMAEADLRAIAVFLKELPQEPAPVQPDAGVVAQPALALGAKIYDKQCAACHGDAGQGAAGAYPALAGNRAVKMAYGGNVVRAVLAGGFAPSTAGNPRPYGMPPFAQSLDDAEIAAVVSFMRGAWGNNAGPVSPLEVLRLRDNQAQ